jgi:hypothetical protein
VSIIVAEKLVEAIEVLRDSYIVDLMADRVMVFSGGDEVAAAAECVAAWIRVGDPQHRYPDIIRGELGVSIALDPDTASRWSAVLGLQPRSSPVTGGADHR